MSIFKKLGTFLIAVFTVVTLAACDDDHAEEAGENIDEMVTDAGNAVEDACEDMKEGVDAEDTDC